MNVAGLQIGNGIPTAVALSAKASILKPIGQDALLPSRDELCRLMMLVASDRDRAAFSVVFGHFAPRLKAFHLRSGLSDQAAEDLVQETMLTVWRKASYFDPGRAGVSTWIFTIARNLRIDRLRRERVKSSDACIDPSGEPELPASAEEIAIAAEREMQVRTALAALPQDQATVVRLSFFSETPHAEIARQLGIPLGTVKSRVRLAMGRLRALLDGEV